MLTNKKRITFFINELNFGGSEMAMKNLANSLLENYEISVLTINKGYNLDFSKEISIHSVLKKRKHKILNILLIPFFAKKLKTFLSTNKSDFCISFLETSNFINCFANKNSNCKHIITISTALSQWYLPNTLNGIIGTLLVKKLYPKADCIVACSKLALHDLKQVFSVNIPNMHVVYNGIDLQKINVEKEEMVINQKNEFWFSHLGGLNEVKNHKLLIDAFDLIHDDVNAKLVLMGKGPLYSKIENYISKKKSASNILLLGFTANPYAYISKSDCFVLSSNFEGLPTVIMEAIACNTPVISTDCISGPRELLSPESEVSYNYVISEMEVVNLGVLVPTQNVNEMARAMLFAYKNSGFLNVMKTKYVNVSLGFDVRIAANRYAKILESL